MQRLRFLINFQTLLIVFFVQFFLTFSAFAEQLPLKLYTSADGLASSAVTNVFKDSRGFLWFSTRDGLSRFDGREFTNYRIGEKTGAMTFWAVCETRDGAFWISTSDGLYRLKPNQKNDVKPDNINFKTGEPLKLNAEKVSDITPSFLFEDNRNYLWAGAGDLFLVAENGELKLEKIDLGKEANGNRQNPNAVSIAETTDGSLWIAAIAGIVRKLPDGKTVFYPITSLSDYAGSQTVVADEKGRIWVVHSGGLFIFMPETLAEITNLPNFTPRKFNLNEQFLENAGKIFLPEKTGEMLRLNLKKSTNDISGNSLINGVFQSSDKKIWVTADEYIFAFEGESYQRLQDRNGFAPWTGRINEDANGDLWVGTSGVLKFSRSGLTSYGAIDGLVRTNITRIQQSTDGTNYFLHGIDWRVSKIAENGIESAKLNLPESAKMLWTSNAALLDRNGNWWALAENGLYQFAKNSDLKEVNNSSPKVYTIDDGLKGNSLYCAFEDSQGNIWFSTRGREEWSGLTRYDPNTQRFYAFTASDGFPEGQSPISFAEDKNGSLWFGFYNGGLVRFAKGRFTDFSKAENLPQGGIFGLFVDEKNRLWIGSTRDGLARVDNVSAEKLEFAKYTTAEGLISNNIRTLTGDLDGNIYAGTVRGISRISPETGNIKHFTTAEGLAADFVTASFRDKTGTLWFGTADGLSKLVPQAETKSQNPPQVWISSLTIAGNRYTVSEFGQTEISNIETSASENNLQIEFLSVGNSIRYQYKLEGADNSDWSELTAERRVNFANLAPDSYRFLVRAINENGQTSEKPAVLNFTIRPPFYRSWWFLTFAFLLMVGAIFALDRYRVSKTRQVQTAYNELQKAEKERRAAETALQKSREERLAELERVRTRIATDLHDDIGSSLTQIAVLSSVAKSSPKDSDSFEDSLENISGISNELVESMSDIVWAINPRKDNLRDLVQRMRRFAADVFTAKAVKFQFVAPDVETNVQVGANIRRELFSIFKESVNNSIKHSECKNAKIEFRIENDQIYLDISDDGKGFEVSEFLAGSLSYTKGGNGLLNIQRRAQELGGYCEITSEIGKGTTVCLKIPLERDSAGDIHTSQMAGDITKKVG